MKNISKINYFITLLTVIVILIASIIVDVVWVKRLIILNSFNVLVLWWFVSLTINPRFQSRKPLSEIQSHQEKAEQNWTVFLRVIAGVFGIFFVIYQFFPFLNLSYKVISRVEGQYSKVYVTSVDKGVVPFSIYFYQGAKVDMGSGSSKKYNIYFNNPLHNGYYEFFVIKGSDIVLDVK